MAPEMRVHPDRQALAEAAARDAAALLRAASGGVVRGYSDASSAFLWRAMGLVRELSPPAVDSGAWYRQKVQPDLGPRLLEQLAENAPNPVHDGGRGPSLWSLSGLVKGATRWTDDELTNALEGLGRLERQLRGEGRTEAFAAWLGRSLCAGRG